MFHMQRLRERLRQKGLAVALWALFVVSAFLMLKSSNDQPLSSLRGTVADLLISPFSTGNQIIFDLSVGIIVSLLIYVLVVWVPERSKHNRIRRNLEHHYELFKEGCITVFLSALQQPYDPELISRLKDRVQFREYFKEKVSPDQNRWHAVLNGLNQYMVKNLIVELEILMAEVHFTLNAIDVDNQEAFAFLKRLAQVLYRVRNWSLQDDDELKQLSQFMWSVHSGWSVIEGYLEKDVIAEMIEAI